MRSSTSSPQTVADEVWNLTGETITSVSWSSPTEYGLDPTLHLRSGGRLEVVSDAAFDTWTISLPESSSSVRWSSGGREPSAAVIAGGEDRTSVLTSRCALGRLRTGRVASDTGQSGDVLRAGLPLVDGEG